MDPNCILVQIVETINKDWSNLDKIKLDFETIMRSVTQHIDSNP